MKLWGWWVLAGGLALAIISFIVPNTVETPKTEYLPYAQTTITVGVQEVFNLGRAQLQMMLLHAGCALLITGAVLAGAGSVAERIGVTTATPPLLEDPVVTPEVTAEVPTSSPEPALTIEEAEEQRRKTKNDTFALVAGIVAVILVILAFASVQSQPPTASPIENNAEALANKLEAEADNIDALARVDAGGARDAERDNPFK